jgi:hypothetical protein
MAGSCFYIVQQIYVKNTVYFKRPTTAQNFWILYYTMVLSPVSPHSCHIGTKVGWSQAPLFADHHKSLSSDSKMISGI